MSELNGPDAVPDRSRPRAVTKRVLALLVAALGVTLLLVLGRSLWTQFGDYRMTRQAAEDSAPVGYVGVHLRRTYHDRPAQFLSEQAGRKLLWAAKGDDGKPVCYDVTDATIRVESLSGGFGRDSNPGIDYPLFERPDSTRAVRLRGNQKFYGLVLRDGPRAYPADLLRKIEVVNDDDGSAPFAVVFDRSREDAKFYDRILGGRAMTFGTTGYAYGTNADPGQGKPLLYDRRTKGLWLPEEDALVCVGGELNGTRLPVFKQSGVTTWSAWRDNHPRTLILMGSDRGRPIPSD
jgi:hypothetical protein